MGVPGASPETPKEPEMIYALTKLWPVLLFLTAPLWVGAVNRILSSAF